MRCWSRAPWRRARLLERREQPLLRLELLDDGLDHYLRGRKLLQTLRERQPTLGLRGRGGGDPTLCRQSRDPRCISPRALASAAALASCRITLSPAVSADWAMPAPIAPRADDADHVKRLCMT